MIKSIIGPPGTGKTLRLEHEIRQNPYPQSFYYLTYNRSMAQLARERIDDNSNRVGTFHSILTRIFGFTDFLTDDMLKTFAHTYGLTHSTIDFFNPESTTDTSRFLQWYSATVQSLQKPRQPVDEKLNLLYLMDKYEKFKETNGVMDYNDILIQSLDRELPYVYLLTIDEAQDLSKVMWKIIDKWSTDTKVICGDDQQSIYGYLGADLNGFLAHLKEPEVLGQSYRFGEAIREYSDNVIKPATLIRRSYKGMGDSTVQIERPYSFLQRKGVKAVLCRSNNLAREVAKRLDVPAIPINREHSLGNGWTPNTFLFTNIFHRYPNWNPGDWQRIIEHTPASIWQRGIKTKAKRGELSLFSFDMMKHKPLIQDLINLLNLTPKQKGNILRYYKAPDLEPIYIDTIHSAKGLEFDNVMLISDRPGNINIDNDERRVLYVGATRARKALSLHYFGIYPNGYNLGKYL